MHSDQWLAKKDVDMFVGFDRDAVSMGTFSTAL